MMGLPELLLDVQTAADNARRRHSLEDVLVAAGMPRPRRVDRETIVGRLVIAKGLTHPDDVQAIREAVNEILSLANL
jgi:hypothetical protein